MTDEWRTGNDLEGSGRGLVEVFSRHLRLGNEQKHENLGQHRWCLGRDSSRAPPEYESRALSLLQSVQCNEINFAIYRSKELAKRPTAAWTTRRARSVHMGLRPVKKTGVSLCCAVRRESTCKWIKLPQSGSIQRTEPSLETKILLMSLWRLPSLRHFTWTQQHCPTYKGRLAKCGRRGGYTIACWQLIP
jgi:hypothetical protein